MSNKKISELTTATSIASEDLIPLVVNPTDNPATRKATVEQLFDAVTIAASQITSGTIDDARIPATITRDTELTAGLATKEASGTAAAAVATHESALDPHPQYAKEADLGTAAYQDSAYLLDRANHTGSQAISTITNLQTTLDGKQASLGYTPLNPANNLSDLNSATTARTNLGLGTAATQNSTAFATSAQGALADTALQPGAIGSTVQPFDSDLAAIAELTTTEFGRNGLTRDTLRLGTAGVSIGDVWRNGNLIQYRDGANSPRTLINSEDNLANLGNVNVSRRNLLGIDQQVGNVKPTTRSDGTTLVVGDRWLDTSGDRAWWYWDGAYWLSEQRYSTGVAIAASVNTQAGILTAPSGVNFYLLDFRLYGLFLNPQNAVDYWSVSLDRATLGTNAQTSISSVTMNSLNISSSFQWQRFSTTLNLHQDLAALNAAGYRVLFAKVAAAGNLSNIDCRITYRHAKP